jgi:ABC-2 type transport system ATP-binding protein
MLPSNEIIIQTKNLSKTFGEVKALKSLDLSIPKHAIVGFLGPNGAGKSTTIKLLLGLTRPTEGSGTIFGLDIVHQSSEIRKRVGYLSQQPRFYPEMTAREVLRFTAHFFYKGPKQAIEDRIQEMLELVDLESKADRPVQGFSGGERQRLGIAQAQVNYPDLLILDEPAAALDPMGRHDVLQIMEKLRKYTTIFYSTHILDDVQRVSDRVVILNHGELIAQGAIADLVFTGDRVIYNLEIEGEVGNTQKRLELLPWVTSQSFSAVNGHQVWQIGVNDEKAAKASLLREILSDGKVNVLNFGRETFDLEQIFLQLVQGEK